MLPFAGIRDLIIRDLIIPDLIQDRLYCELSIIKHPITTIKHPIKHHHHHHQTPPPNTTFIILQRQMK